MIRASLRAGRSAQTWRGLVRWIWFLAILVVAVAFGVAPGSAFAKSNAAAPDTSTIAAHHIRPVSDRPTEAGRWRAGWAAADVPGLAAGLFASEGPAPEARLGPGADTAARSLPTDDLVNLASP